MYSVKPGRGPSLMGGVVGIAVALFGVFWTMGAMSKGAPPFFALFGVVFVVVAVVGVIYNFANAVGRDRMSTFDITSGEEESDPIADALGHNRPQPPAEREENAEGAIAQGTRRFPGEFCPFCGAKAGPQCNYCPQCGKDI